METEIEEVGEMAKQNLKSLHRIPFSIKKLVFSKSVPMWVYSGSFFNFIISISVAQLQHRLKYFMILNFKKMVSPW